jgi:hypothetical protein
MKDNTHQLFGVINCLCMHVEWIDLPLAIDENRGRLTIKPLSLSSIFLPLLCPAQRVANVAEELINSEQQQQRALILCSLLHIIRKHTTM